VVVWFNRIGNGVLTWNHCAAVVHAPGAEGSADEVAAAGSNAARAGGGAGH
jgi:hypothetical protein